MDTSEGVREDRPDTRAEREDTRLNDALASAYTSEHRKRDQQVKRMSYANTGGGEERHCHCRLSHSLR